MNLKKETISIVTFSEYNGNYDTVTNILYFKSEGRAKNYLEGEGYGEDEFHEWQKDYSNTATIRNKQLI